MIEKFATFGSAKRIAPILFWIGLALFGFGFVYNRMWHAVSLGSSQLVWLLLLAAAASGVLRWLGKKWFDGCTMASVLLLVGLAALIGFAGVLSVLSVVLIGLVALGVGSFLVPAHWDARVPLALLVGLAILCGVDGWLLPFPMHYRAVYLVIFALLLIWRWRPIIGLLRPLKNDWLTAVNGAGTPAALTLLVLFAASAWAWLPTTMYDDLAYHLALPSQLAQLGYYRMDVASNVWALAPWAADVLQAMTQVVAGTESRGAVDMLWLGLSCALLWQLCRALSLSAALRWLAVALFAALPMSMMLLHSMQTEGPTVTVMLALAWVIVARPQPDRRMMAVLGVLFGLLIGLKVSNLWFAGPLGLWFLLRHRRDLPWRGLPLALLGGALVAGSSYVYAWTLTGNPVLPLFNGFFQSPWYGLSNFHDARWATGFGWDIIWNLVFHPGTYIESDSIGPLVLVALSGCFLVALAKPKARGLALVGLLALLLPLSQIQYLRYAYPALALLIPALLCGVPVASVGRHHARGMWVALWSLVMVSTVFAGSSGWQVKSGALGQRVTAGKRAVIGHYKPVRLLMDTINQRYGTSARVLVLADTPFAAQMAGRAFVTNWYDPTLSALTNQARKRGNEKSWQTLIHRSGANVLIVRKGKPDAGLRQAMQARDAQKIMAKHDLIAWRLPASRPAHVTRTSAHVWQATFDTHDAPPAGTLAFASLSFHCQADAAGQGQVRIDWHVQSAGGSTAQRQQLLTCTRKGQVKADVRFRTPAQVSVLRAIIQPVSPTHTTLKPIMAKASLLRDLSTQRDMARRVWRGFGFHATQRGITWITP